VFLIKALQDVGQGQWFDVVERVGIDSLTRERTLIRQMREAYEGTSAKPLMPLHFAGIIMEGGIIGYDSSTESGGAAHRFLGVGTQTQYSKDTVTVSLRAVSVNTGKVLVAVTVTKIVYSTADSVAMLKFLRQGTAAFEAETGLTINEPGTLAVKATVEAAVVELIREGERKGIWEFKKPQQAQVSQPGPVPEARTEPVAKTPETRPVVQAKPQITEPQPTQTVVVEIGPIIATVLPQRYTVQSSTRIREHPNTDSKIIAMIRPGQEVEKLEEISDWTKVSFEDKIGWVNTKLLKEIK
jgi:curli biogenesis system outer membrane secretion channel CsgG